MNLFNKKPDPENTVRYIVNSRLDPVAFQTRSEARQFKKLLKNSLMKAEGVSITKVTVSDGYTESQEVS